MNKDIISFLSKTLNKDKDAVASLFNEDGSLVEDGLEKLNDMDAERVQSLKTKYGKDFDNGYKKAQSEILKRTEKALKDSFGYEGDESGDELIAAIVAHAKTAQSDSGKTLSDDDVKKHPAYLSLEKEMKKQLKEATETGEKALNEYKATIEKDKRFSTVAERALKLVNEKKPILPSDAEKAKIRLQRDVIDQLKGAEYEITDDGEILILKDGKRLEDKHGHPVKFEDYVFQVASSSLEFQTVDPKNPAHGTPPPGGKTDTGKPAFVMPTLKTKAEWDAYTNNPEIPLEHRLAVASVEPPKS